MAGKTEVRNDSDAQPPLALASKAPDISSMRSERHSRREGCRAARSVWGTSRREEVRVVEGAHSMGGA